MGELESFAIYSKIEGIRKIHKKLVPYIAWHKEGKQIVTVGVPLEFRKSFEEYV